MSHQLNKVANRSFDRLQAAMKQMQHGRDACANANIIDHTFIDQTYFKF